MMSDKLSRVAMFDLEDAESIIDCYRDTIDSWLTEGESDRISIREMIGILTEQIKVHIEVELYGIV